MSIFFNYNDTIYKEGALILSPDSRSLKYGDGLFETMKVNNGKIYLCDHHFERLFAGMAILQFEVPKHFTKAYLEKRISELCKKNEHNSYARVRLTIFRGNGGLYVAEDHTFRDFSSRRNDGTFFHLPHYIIQTWPIEHTGELNSNGLVIDIYPDARKPCDTFANFKTNNFLPYAMAAIYAKQIKADDCILLNSYDRICDSTIANIFIIKDNVIYTPALPEGCIAGVMRRFLIENLKGSNFNITERRVSIEDLENADEVFLTNSIRGIRWVKQFRNRTYKTDLVKDLYKTIHIGNY
ncbi:MAG TPA: aminotransferase class IV [Chitinophagaceae bacterium]|nr:aminotransferase class IV [Chitinophagaceae bacterium]